MNEEKKITNFTIPILIILLVVAAFLVGTMWTKIKTLEGGKGEVTKKVATASPAPEQPAVLGAEQIAKLTETGQVLGEEDAKVTMVEFSDFQCPFCASYFKETFPKIMEEYIKTGKVRYIFHHFPLSFHQYAQKAGEAGECAGEQGKFWEMHDKIFENQEKITEADLRRYAGELGLKGSEFNICLDTGKLKDKVQADLNLGQSAGVQGTPAFFINGQLVSGAQPFANFKTLIDAELEK